MSDTDQAIALLDAALDAFMAEVRDAMHRGVNDTISAQEVLLHSTDPWGSRVQRIVYGCVQSSLYEAIEDRLGAQQTARFFDHAYYQICGQHLGPADFRDKAKPYDSV